MGFKDIESFNQALLGKQAWRIIQNPDSTLSKLLKSRYFKNNDFLEAKKGTRPSFGWRSILYGRDLIRSGMDKRVVNGESISVWLDPWLPYHPPRPPWRKNLFFDLNLKVADLIDKENGGWSNGHLQELFFPDDCRMIRKITPIISEDDYWIWRHTKSGDYSVKSGYKVAMEINQKELITEAMTLPSMNILKTEVWKLNTQPKIRHFLWRAVANSLPVQERLCSKGIKVEPTCQRCGIFQETTNHVMFTCSIARQTWALSYIPLPCGGFDDNSFPSNLHYVILQQRNSRIPLLNRRSIPWIMWCLWKNRNAHIFKGEIFSASDSISKILQDTCNWFEAQKISPGPQQGNRSQEMDNNVKWDPPPHNWLKCNSAFSWKRNKKLGGGSWILRDESGNVLLHSRRSFTNIIDIRDLQVKVLAWTIRSVSEHHLDRVIFVSEASDIVNSLLRPKAWPSFKSLRAPILAALRAIQWWRIEIGTKGANIPANLIASSVTKDNRWRSYVASGPPSWLVPILSEEALEYRRSVP